METLIESSLVMMTQFQERLEEPEKQSEALLRLARQNETRVVMLENRNERWNSLKAKM